jgi:ElaB/YqjD/DUF883 family membrane-anchored ribosome-binding protein
MSKKNPSRAERFSDVMSNMDSSSIDDARTEVETLKDELQSWLDNMPDNLQSSQKANDLQTAIDELDEIESELQTIIDSIQEQADKSVEFPTMFS